MSNLLGKLHIKLPRHLPHGRYEIGRNPSLDWLLILIGSLLIAICMISFTFFSYGGFGADMTEVESTTATSTPKLISKELVERVTTYFEERGSTFDAVLAKPPSLGDPSESE